MSLKFTRDLNLESILFLICSQFFLASMDATGKYLSTSYSPFMLVWARYLVLFLLILGLRGPQLLGHISGLQNTAMHILRAALLLITSILGLYALKLLPLAETAALAFTTPFFAIFFAKIFLGESIGWLRWFCMLGAVSGGFLIVRPSASLSMLGVFLVISASISFAFYQIITRKLAPKVERLVLLVYPAGLGAIVMTFFLPIFYEASMPSIMDIPLIILLGVFSGVGHYCSNRAFSLNSVSNLAPYMYLQLGWALLLGWLFFGQLPGALSFCGLVLIVICGVFSSLNSKSCYKAR